MKRKRQITAGRLQIVVSYTVASLQDTQKARADKVKASTAARQAINLRYSWQKLEVVLAANFTARDLFVTLTYADESLPSSRVAAVNQIKKFLRRLRDVRRRRGESTQYIYVTEQLSAEGGRLHHHLVINGTGPGDLDEVSSLWGNGNADVEHLEVGGNDNAYAEYAKYLTKEARQVGSAEIGARTWVPSLGLSHPEPETADMDDNMTIAPPPGAYILEAPPPSRNEHGEFCYLKYLLPISSKECKYRRPQKRRKKE